MRDDHRTPSDEVLAVKVPRELARTIRQAARADDRTVSGYLRRKLADLMQRETRNDSAPAGQ